MANDLVFIKNFLIDVRDMSEFIGKVQSAKEKIFNKERVIVRIDITEFKKLLEDKGINQRSATYNLSEYIELIQKNEWFDEEYSKKIIDMYLENRDICKWQQATKNLIQNRAKPESFFLIDYELERELFQDQNGSNSQLEQYILRNNINHIDDLVISDQLFNIPFLSKNEYLYFMVSLFDEKEDILIDITERQANKLEYLRKSFNIHKHSVFYREFEENYIYLKENLKKYTDDQLVCNLFIPYAISLFESYLKNIIRLAANSSNYYLREIIKKDDRMIQGKKQIKYEEIFDKLFDVRELVNSSIDKESFQSEATFETYIKYIFKTYDDERYKIAKERYLCLLHMRHDIIHNSILTDFEEDKFLSYLENLKDITQSIDSVVLRSVIV